MKTAAFALAAVLALGCSGRLEFDPRLGDGSASLQNRGAGGKPAVAPPADDEPASTPEAKAPWADAGRPPWMDAASPGWEDPVGPDPVAPPARDAGSAVWTDPDARPPVAAADAAAPEPTDPPVASACPAGFDVLAEVFTKKCGSCHGASAPARGLDLVSPGLAARVVGVKSMCEGRLLLGRDAVPAGHLLAKMQGPVTGCGVRMPSGRPPLTDVELACVEQWAVAAIAKVTGGKP